MDRSTLDLMIPASSLHLYLLFFLDHLEDVGADVAVIVEVTGGPGGCGPQ